MDIFFVLIAVILVLIWFSRKIIFKFVKGYLIEKVVYLLLSLLFILLLLIVFFVFSGYSEIQMAYQERVPQIITANSLITQGTDKNWLKITEATLNIDKAWYRDDISNIKEAYIPLQASSKPLSFPKVIVISKNKDILGILNIMKKDDISAEEKITLNSKLKLYENIVVNGRKIPSYEGDSKIIDEIRNKIGDHVIFIAHDETLSYSNGLIRLSISLLSIFGIATIIWLNRQFITIYLINIGIALTPLFGIVLGFFIVDGYTQIQTPHRGKTFHTITANDLIEQETDKNWLKITEATLSIDKAWLTNDPSGMKKAYIPLHASSKSLRFPKVILITENQEILKILNTIIWYNSSGLSLDNLNDTNDLYDLLEDGGERITISAKLKQYENIIVNGKKILWNNVDIKTRNEIQNKMIDDVIVIIHDETLTQVPSSLKGWDQLSISLLCLFGMIILIWFKRKVYFVFYKGLLIESDTVLAVLIIIFIFIGGSLIVTSYSQTQWVYQEKEPHIITASDLIKQGTDKNWLTITEAVLSIDEAWYIGNSSNLRKAYIPLYSSKSSLSPNIFLISDNQDILEILNTTIQDNLSVEEKVTLNAKLKKYENISINGITKPSYSIDKIMDKIENEVGKNVTFIIHGGTPSYLEAGIRLLMGLLCVLMVIMLFRLERKFRPNG